MGITLHAQWAKYILCLVWISGSQSRQKDPWGDFEGQWGEKTKGVMGGENNTKR